ncbi:hypothetical protein IscW_ISCW006374, partial [Ixodes scapularis]
SRKQKERCRRRALRRKQELPVRSPSLSSSARQHDRGKGDSSNGRDVIGPRFAAADTRQAEERRVPLRTESERERYFCARRRRQLGQLPEPPRQRRVRRDAKRGSTAPSRVAPRR